MQSDGVSSTGMSKGKSELILMAEDSPTQAAHLQWLLEDAGYRVNAATNGREALELARQEPPNLVISDVVMPGMGGYELCKAIKEDPALKAIPVVLVTSMSHPRDVVAGLNCGADNFITKPYDGDHLITRLRYLTANSKLQATEKMHLGVHIELQGESHFITAERKQVLDLLISTYDAAVRLNDDLRDRQQELEVSIKSLDGLTHIIEALNRSTSMDAVLHEALGRTMEMLDAAAGWLTLEDETGEPAMLAIWEGVYPTDIPLVSHPVGDGEPITGVHWRRAATTDGQLSQRHLHIPIQVESQLLGSLNLRLNDPLEIDDRSRSMLTAVGLQVGVAIERARLLENLEDTVQRRTTELRREIAARRNAQEAEQARSAQLAELVRLGDLALTQNTLDRLFREALECACRTLGTQRGSVWLHEPENDDLKMIAWHGWDDGSAPHQIPRACKSTLGQTLAGTHVAVEDWLKEPSPERPNFLAIHDIRSTIAVPIRGHGHVMGMFALDSEVPGAFKENDIAFLASIGNVVGAAVIRAESLAALQHSEDEFRATFEQAPIGIGHINADGSWLRANAYISTVFGYGRDELDAKSYFAIFHPEHRATIEEATHRLFNGASEQSIDEVRILNRDGRDLWTRVTMSVKCDENNNAEYVIAVLEDVTEKRDAQAKISHLQRMDAIGRLTGGIAHDFNNLLTLIIGNLEPLQQRLSAGSLEATFAAGALKGAGRAAELTQRLLALSRRQTLKSETVDINALIEGVLDMMKRSFASNIEVLSRPSEQICRCKIDTTELETVLMNLAVNSMDAMPDGGRFVVSTDIQNFSEQDAAELGDIHPGRYAEITISDTGCGIPDHIKEQVLEPYFTTKDRGKGTGLGLSLVDAFVKRSGGRLALYSEVGRGTTIRICLPLEDSPDASAAQAVTARGQPNECVLIVDDDDSLRKMIVAQIRGLGYATREASNVQQALSMLRAGLDIDVMVTDIVMPGPMDGIMLAQQVLDTYPEVMVVISSGFDAYVMPDWIESSSRCAVVRKPSAVANMASTIRHLIDRDTSHA
ncbi:response regulator [Ancylobacter pratisalsi]|uniref:histidine kinase n=1 Tax=Ancylobacter pratisalsi TaxID=1745854 RepID=A0A6P1YMJ7_9HYPH|nr:response regulator [Ancylobacter pratisalsi]QIB34539.1 response regulator [Ancylobacter pratisalsi]